MAFDYQSYFAANPDIAWAWQNQNPTYVPQGLLGGSPEAFAQWQYQTYGQNEGRNLSGQSDLQVQDVPTNGGMTFFNGVPEAQWLQMTPENRAAYQASGARSLVDYLGGQAGALQTGANINDLFAGYHNGSPEQSAEERAAGIVFGGSPEFRGPTQGTTPGTPTYTAQNPSPGVTPGSAAWNGRYSASEIPTQAPEQFTGMDTSGIQGGLLGNPAATGLLSGPAPKYPVYGAPQQIRQQAAFGPDSRPWMTQGSGQAAAQMNTYLQSQRNPNPLQAPATLAAFDQWRQGILAKPQLQQQSRSISPINLPPQVVNGSLGEWN